MKGKNKQKKPTKKPKQQKEKSKDVIQKRFTYKQTNKKKFAFCHSGNHAIFTYGDATLFAGGWTRKGSPRHSWALIDLADVAPRTREDYSLLSAGNKSGSQAFSRTIDAASHYKMAPTLDFPIPDYGIPTFNREVWLELANDVMDIMKSGMNVYVGCVGGHGRTGLVVSILAGLIRPDLTMHDPVSWLRDIYCEKAVETYEQLQYVFDILDLNMPAGLDVTSYGYYNWRDWENQDFDKKAASHISSITHESYTDDDELKAENKAAYAREQAHAHVCQRCEGFGYEDMDDGSCIMCEDCDGFGTY